MTTTQIVEMPREIMSIIFENYEDKELSVCLTVCKAWSEIILEIQKTYQKQLERRGLWGEYLLIKYPFMSEVFIHIYFDRIVLVSPKQAFLDWKRFCLS